MKLVKFDGRLLEMFYFIKMTAYEVSLMLYPCIYIFSLL
jgi:hypothetical protein